jgi:hypothetical protein
MDENKRLTGSGDLVVERRTVQISETGKIVGCHDGSLAFEGMTLEPSYSGFAVKPPLQVVFA